MSFYFLPFTLWAGAPNLTHRILRNMMADSGRIHSGPILKIVVEWDTQRSRGPCAPSILTHALLGKLISGQTNFIGLLKVLGLCPQKKCLNRPAAAEISLKL